MPETSTPRYPDMLIPSHRWLGTKLTPHPDHPDDPHKKEKKPRSIKTRELMDVSDRPDLDLLVALEEALAALGRCEVDAIGYCFTQSTFIGVDLDLCRDPQTGEIDPWAKAFLSEFPPTYTEPSQSGTGLHPIYQVDARHKPEGVPFTQLPQIIAERHDVITSTYRVRPLLVIEDASAGTQAIDVLRSGRPDIPMIPITAVKSKQERGLSVAHFVQGGVVGIGPGEWREDFINELACFPGGGRYDDRADAFVQTPCGTRVSSPTTVRTRRDYVFKFSAPRAEGRGSCSDSRPRNRRRLRPYSASKQSRERPSPSFSSFRAQ